MLDVDDFLRDPALIGALSKRNLVDLFGRVREIGKGASPDVASKMTRELLSAELSDAEISEFRFRCAIYLNARTWPEDRRNFSFQIAKRARDGFTQGVAWFSVDERDLAADAFARFSAAVPKSELVGDEKGAMSVRPSSYLPSMSVSPDIDVIRLADQKTEGPVFLVSCDMGYLQAFGPEFLSHCQAVGSSVHLHVINPNSDTSHFVPKDVGLSFEVVRFGDVRTYTSIARYIVAPDILEIYSKIMVSDIDMEISRHPRAAWRDDYDVGLVTNIACGAYFPWTAVLAGQNWFSSNHRSKIFLKLLRDYLVEHYQAGWDGWTLDQVALEWVLHKSDLAVFDIREAERYPLRQVQNRVAKRNQALRTNC